MSRGKEKDGTSNLHKSSDQLMGYNLHADEKGRWTSEGQNSERFLLGKGDLSLSSTGTEEGRVQSAERHSGLAFSSLHCEPAHVGISLAMTEERERVAEAAKSDTV